MLFYNFTRTSYTRNFSTILLNSSAKRRCRLCFPSGIKCNLKRQMQNKYLGDRLLLHVFLERSKNRVCVGQREMSENCFDTFVLAFTGKHNSACFIYFTLIKKIKIPANLVMLEVLKSLPGANQL